MSRSLYDILGVKRTSRPDTIKRAYRKLAALHHPDRNPGDPDCEARYRAVVEAWEVLSDPIRRKRYDETGERGRPTTGVEHDLLVTITPFLLQSVHDCIRANRATKMNLAKFVTDVVKNELSAMQRQLANLKAGATGLRAVCGRFSHKDGSDFLDQIIRRQATDAENAVAQCTEAVRRLEAAVEYLSGCDYRTDGNPLKSAFAISDVKYVSI